MHGQILEQVFQGGHGISIPGDNKNPTGQHPEQPALVDSALSRGVD